MSNEISISVIIPAIIINRHLNKCVDEILKISNFIEIIILLDKYSKEVDVLYDRYPNIKIKILEKKLNISQKRNFGVTISQKKFIAFIDSDAYPEEEWIKNSLKILNENTNIYLVGGPNISPENQKWQNSIIGEVQKSFMITGKWNFQKMISKSRFAENLYSCNMVMLKKTFIENGGMNENLDAGEDYDFCNKINDNGKRIFFNKHSIVYHYDRNFKNFIIQKIVRGFSIVDQIKNKSNLFKKNYIEFILYQLIPLYFIIFNLSVIFFLLTKFKIDNNISTAIILLYSFYFIVSLSSIFNTSKKNIKYVLLILFFIILGNLSIGFGSLISIIGFKKIFKFYKNY